MSDAARQEWQRLFDAYRCCGLRNTGNSCYVSASVQLLWSLPAWRAWLDARPPSARGSIVEILRRLLCDGPGADPAADAEANRIALLVWELRQDVDALSAPINPFSPRGQEDAGEFLHFVAQLAVAAGPGYTPFTFESLTSTRCCVPACAEQATWERRRQESLLLAFIDGVGTVQGMLQAEFAPVDNVECTCGTCSSQKKNRQAYLSELPDVFEVVLLRFKDPVSKIKTPVLLNAELDLSPYIRTFEDDALHARDPPLGPHDAQYVLVAVVRHVDGETVKAGHYVTDRLVAPAPGGDGSRPAAWHRFDDDVVSRCDALQQTWAPGGSDCGEAYILVYVKKPAGPPSAEEE